MMRSLLTVLGFLWERVTDALGTASAGRSDPTRGADASTPAAAAAPAPKPIPDDAPDRPVSADNVPEEPCPEEWEDPYECSEYVRQADGLPEGYQWHDYDDGSGQLESPEGRCLCTYDLMTGEVWWPGGESTPSYGFAGFGAEQFGVPNKLAFIQSCAERMVRAQLDGDREAKDRAMGEVDTALDSAIGRAYGTAPEEDEPER